MDWLCELSKYPHPVFPGNIISLVYYKSETGVNYVISFLF